ncbi:MAG: hypothetical protein WCP92_08165 [bacterium]
MLYIQMKDKTIKDKKIKDVVPAKKKAIKSPSDKPFFADKS